MRQRSEAGFAGNAKGAVWKRLRSVVLGALPAVLASVHAEQLPVKKYTSADGLARDKVTRIRQDSRGFLWFCTSEGISRFDGFGLTTRPPTV